MTLKNLIDGYVFKVQELTDKATGLNAELVTIAVAPDVYSNLEKFYLEKTFHISGLPIQVLPGLSEGRIIEGQIHPKGSK